MADLSINVNLGNLTDAERNQLMELVEKSMELKEKYEYGQQVWYITDGGEVKRTQWSGSTWQYWLDSIGELYPTENDAIEGRKRKIFQAEWKRLAEESGEPNRAWDDSNYHWRAYYSALACEVRVSYHTNSREEATYFASKDAVQRAIRIIGDENVKQYILGVRE